MLLPEIVVFKPPPKGTNEFFEFSASTVSLVSFSLEIPLQAFQELLSLAFDLCDSLWRTVKMAQVTVLCD